MVSQVLTPLGGTVRVDPLAPHLMARIDDDLEGVMLRLGMQSPRDHRLAEVVLSGENRRELAALLLEDLPFSLEEIIKVAIGYDPVPLSIRDHPEITFEYRTITDRDGLVERISAAIRKHILTVPRNVD